MKRNAVQKVAGTLRVPSAEPQKTLFFEGYGTWNVPTTLFFEGYGTWNVPTTLLFEGYGTWNVPTTLTRVDCVEYAYG